MGDFLVSVGAAGDCALSKAAAFLQFYPDMRVNRFDYSEFSLVLSSADREELWAPFVSPDQTLLVALAGRISLDQEQWEAAARVAGQGGLACKCISRLYSASGITAVEALSGNFVILVFDRSAQKMFLVTDRWGLFPAFRFKSTGGRLAFGSHPDALADAVSESRNWDLTSFAEFILTGKLSAPFTYYQQIKALPVACTTTLSFLEQKLSAEQTHTYFQFQPQSEPTEKAEALSERFAVAFRQAVTRRTLPILGRSAVALSGGLDSRTVLCAAPNRQAVLTFTCYDQENREFRIAESIAQAAGAEFIPLKRGCDYYGEQAGLGVRISAGMGCIASNHFLGFRPQLRDLGVQNLLTGCYCDYLFKGLAYNKRVNRWTTVERLGPFDFSYYFKHFASNTDLGTKVRQRLETVFPPNLRRYDTPSAVHAVEQRRMFPLAYEEDNAERTIPQRVMGWYVPVAENDLMGVVREMSCAMKLNRSLFAETVTKICGEAISNIPDANTGVPVNASVLREAAFSHLRRAGQLLEHLKPSSATNGSWLNWGYYARTSKVVQSLWSSPNSDAFGIFREVLGREAVSTDIAAYSDGRTGLFLQLFTLKLWFDQRLQ
jgi:asparagine synthase (glutamine-hydrolysing)